MSGNDNRSWWSFGFAGSLAHGRLHYGQVRGGEGTVRRRLAMAAVAIMVVLAVGTVGYYLIGGGDWSVEDCAYMVLITITTVGYQEVLPVHDVPNGRVFTMGLLVIGMGVSLYFLSALTAFIIEGDLREALWRRKMYNRLSRLSGHVIVCGGGRTGKHVVDELLHAGCDVLVIEREVKRLDKLTKMYGDRIIAIEGDATEDGMLRDAGVERAMGLVAALELDQDNLFIALSARQLNSQLRIVSRANAERVTPKLKVAGADAIVSPTQIGGRRMAHELLRPNVVGFLDLASHDIQRNLDIEELFVPEGSELVGRKLATSRIREVSNALVLAVIDGDDHTYNPSAQFEFLAGMTLVVMGEREEIERLNKYIGG